MITRLGLFYADLLSNTLYVCKYTFLVYGYNDMIKSPGIVLRGYFVWYWSVLLFVSLSFILFEFKNHFLMRVKVPRSMKMN